MEKRYESDRTAKDKFELEKKKLKSMSFKEKLEYLWTYYKVWLLVFILGCIVIGFLVEIYQNSKYNTILNVAVVNSHNVEENSNAERIILEALGSADEYDRVQLDTTYQLGTDIQAADSNLVMKVSTIVAAGDMDVMVCDRTMYEYFSKQDYFWPMEDLLSEEEKQSYGEAVEQYAVRLENSGVLREMDIVAYEPVYAAVIAGSRQTDNAKAMIKYLKEGE